tara:strand:- start:5792 stop:6598 length:807 start_codon:yes stop_codon:yes gene_type:complete
VTFFTQSSTTAPTTSDTTSQSFTRIDWDTAENEIFGFNFYKDLADAIGIPLEECFKNNKIDLSKYEVPDPDISKYVNSVPTFAQFESMCPFTNNRSNSLYPTTHKRYIAINMINLSVAAYARCWRDLPVTNDNDRHICLNMLKKMQNSERDSTLLHTFTRMGMKISEYIDDAHKLYDIMVKLPANRDSIFRLFGEYGTMNIVNGSAVSYSTGLTAEQLYQLCHRGFIDTHMTLDEVEKLIKTVVKHGLDYTINNTKSLNYFDNHPLKD